MKKTDFVPMSKKLFSTIAFGAFVVLLPMFATIYYAISSEKRGEDLASTITLTKIIAQNIQAPLEFDDPESAKMILETLKHNSSIDAAFLFTPTKEIFSDYTKQGVQTKHSLACLAQLLEKKDFFSTMQIKNGNHMVVSIPVLSANDTLGVLALVANTQALQDAQNKLLKLLVVILLFSLVVIYFIEKHIEKMLSTPLEIMGKAMEKIKKENNYNTHLYPISNDEFQLLFDGFNSMIHTIKQQTDELHKAKKEIEEIYKHTQESIEYASLIQNSLIPDDELLKRCFQDTFTIWEPKDIVGGDIYLFEELRRGEEYLLMVIDCTGHGVPGAFVTMLVKAIESQIVATLNSSDKEVNPAEILTIFNNRMKTLLKQDTLHSISNAGFDGGIIYYNKKLNSLKYAGANTPLFYTQKDRIVTLKGDRYSVGYKKCDTNYSYTQHTIPLEKGMKFFLATDGYVDQNGGDKGFPFGKTRLKNLLQTHIDLSMQEIAYTLIQELHNYQKDEERNDDITVVGFEV